MVENCTGVYIWRFSEVFFLSFSHIDYHRIGWRWAVAVYRGIYVLYIGRIFVPGPKVGGRRGWRSIGGRFNGVLLYVLTHATSAFRSKNRLRFLCSITQRFSEYEKGSYSSESTFRVSFSMFTIFCRLLFSLSLPNQIRTQYTLDEKKE